CQRQQSAAGVASIRQTAPFPIGVHSLADPSIIRRKSEHLRIVAEEDVLHSGGTLLDCVQLLHCALPELDLNDIDLSAQLFGKPLRLPLMITSMTGGAALAAELNRDLAASAPRLGTAFAGCRKRAM